MTGGATLGFPRTNLGGGADSIIDPDGGGPRIWFQLVPDSKAVKNRLHLDIHVSGGRALPLATRRQRVDAEARRLADLGATITGAMSEEGLDHYAVGMKDPGGQRVRHQLTAAPPAAIRAPGGRAKTLNGTKLRKPPWSRPDLVNTSGLFLRRALRRTVMLRFQCPYGQDSDAWADRDCCELRHRKLKFIQHKNNCPAWSANSAARR